MDQARFLLRAYVPRYTVETREACAAQVATYLSLLDTFVAAARVPFRAMCSAYRVSPRHPNFSDALSLISIARHLPFTITTRYQHRDPVLAIIATGFLSACIITGSLGRITVLYFNFLPAERKCAASSTE